MPPRMMVGEQSRPWLSWGELSDEPRSLVLDAVGEFVFEGSPVRLAGRGRGRGALTAHQRSRRGVVTGLTSRTVVAVRWLGECDSAECGGACEVRAAQADTLVVTGPFDRAVHGGAVLAP